MFEDIARIEHPIFIWLNQFHTPIMDQIMYLFSNKLLWMPTTLFMLFILIFKAKNIRRAIFVIIGLVLVIALCDQLTSGILKNITERLRPTHHPSYFNVVNYCYDYTGGRYGFASSHAANAFGCAAYLSLVFKNRLYSFTIFTWAIITGYTRIYLGVHFIADILVGLVIGLVIGNLVYKLKKHICLQYQARHGKTEVDYYIFDSPKPLHYLSYGLLLTYLLVLLFPHTIYTIIGD